MRRCRRVLSQIICVATFVLTVLIILRGRARLALGQRSKRLEKCLWSSPNSWKSYLSDEFYSIMKDLVEHHSWKTYENCANANVLLFVEEYEALLQNMQVLRSKVDILIIFVDDLHWHDKSKWEMKFRLFQNPSVYVFSTYAYNAQKFYPELNSLDNWFWLPHSASKRFQRRLNRTAEFSPILLTGALTPTWYPYRDLVQELGQSGALLDLMIIPHQGYAIEFNASRREQFVKDSSAYAVSITCGSRLHYALAKIFEITAHGQLLLINYEMMTILGSLKLKNDLHYLTYNAHNVLGRIQYASLEFNRPRMLEMRQRAQKLVLQHHTTRKRSEQLDWIAQCVHRSTRNKFSSIKHCHIWNFQRIIDDITLDPGVQMLLHQKKGVV